MLDWIGQQAESAWNTVTGAASSLWHHVVAFVHKMIHAVVGWLTGIFGLVIWAWNHLVEAAAAAWHSLERWGEEVAGWIVTFVTHTLPAIWHKIAHAIEQAWHWVENAVKWAAKRIAHLAAKAWDWVHNAIKWVLRHVWRPLMGFVHDIYSKLRKWALVAWRLVTHPLQLAEVVFWPLWFVFEHVAWKVASKIGKWLAQLVLHNLVKMVNVVEDIVAGVL